MKRLLYISSSLASGVAALLFDIVLLGIIKALSQVLCSNFNLFYVYDKRCALAPETSGLGTLTGGPVGHIALSRFFSVLILVCTICAVFLGFSINGKSVPKFEDTTFKTKVSISSVPLEIDFGEEFQILPVTNQSHPRILVSTRLLAITNSYACHRSNYSHVFVYSYVLRDYVLDKTKIDMQQTLSQATTRVDAECIRFPTFKEEQVDIFTTRLVPMSDLRCSISNLQPVFANQSKTGNATFTTSSCSLSFLPMQCFRGLTTSCAAVGEGQGQEKGNMFIVAVPNVPNSNDVGVFRLGVKGFGEPYDRLARNVAFIQAVTLFTGDLSNHLNMALTNFEYNVTLQERVGLKQVSEIDLQLLTPIVLFFMSVSFLLGAAALGTWVWVVYSKGRVKYTRFTDVSDILAVISPVCPSKFKIKERKMPMYIGVRHEIPRIGLLDTNESCSWIEEEIQ